MRGSRVDSHLGPRSPEVTAPIKGSQPQVDPPNRIKATLQDPYYLGFLGASTMFHEKLSNELYTEHSQPRRSLIAPILGQQQYLEEYVKMHPFFNTWWRVYSSEWVAYRL